MERSSCCHAAAPAERGDPGERLSECGDRRCECGAVAGPEQPQPRLASAGGFEPMPAWYVWAADVRVPSVQSRRAAIVVAARGPPSPDAQRNLPLLL
jgi:hypothetical protein